MYHLLNFHSMDRSETSSRIIDSLNASMKRSETSSRLSAPYTGKRTLYGDEFVNVIKSHFDYVQSRIRIGLEGYNTSLEPIDLYWALESLFKTCGEVDDIEIDRDPVTNALKRSCVVILRGEGAGENALQLNGSDIGGRKIVVTSLPPGISVLRSGLSTDVLAARHVAHHQRHRAKAYPLLDMTLLFLKAISKNSLSNHFSSCGEITDVFVLNSRALVYFYGLGSNYRAVQLSGTDLGGCKLVVNSLPYPRPKDVTGAGGWTRLRHRFRSGHIRCERKIMV